MALDIARWRAELKSEMDEAESRRAFAATFGDLQRVAEQAAATRDEYRNRIAAINAFLKMLEALEGAALVCHCGREDRCETEGNGRACSYCAVSEALRAARKALGTMAPSQRCADLVTNFGAAQVQRVPCHHPLPCPLHTPRAAREAVKP